MRPPGPVRWTQGMFLLPQHFQQNDLYHSAERSYVTDALLPFAWGVRSLDVEEEALKTELFRVRACELLYPDGLVFRFPDAAKLEAASFKEAFKANMDRLGIYLTVSNIDARAGALRRYASQSVQLPDLYPTGNGTEPTNQPNEPSAEDERSIEYVIPRGELILTNDPKDGRLAETQHVKIAEIRRTGAVDRPYELSKDYIPPVVRCAASPVLMRALQDVHEQLRGASGVLGQYRRGPEGLAYGTGDLHQLLALQVINQLLPGLQHALSHGGGHPFVLYGLLAEGRGALTTYCKDLREEAADFPLYAHTDLVACFRPLIESIRRHIDYLLPTQYEEVHLERDGDFFWGPFEREDLLRDAKAFVIAVRGPGEEDAVVRRVERLAKITSSRNMGNLIARNVDGVPFKHDPTPDAELPRLKGYCYFKINTKDPKWKTVREELDISFYIPDAEQEVDARLFAVLPRGHS